MASITIQWFLELPGLFITAGVVLILIAVIVFIVSGSKAKKLANETNQMESVQPVTNNNVQQEFSAAPPLPSTNVTNDLNQVNPVNPINDVPTTLNEQPVSPQPQSIEGNPIIPGELNLNTSDVPPTIVVPEPVSPVNPGVIPTPVNVSIPSPEINNINPAVEQPTLSTPVENTVGNVSPIPEIQINEIPVGGNEVDGTTVIPTVTPTVTNDNEEII